MKLKKYLGLLRLLLVVGFVCWGVTQGVAQTKSAQHKKPAVQSQTPVQPSVTTEGQAGPIQIGGQTLITGQRTITDAAGRVHVRGSRITYAQRKAAAERRVKAIREAAAKRKLAEVKQ
jgi:hypothetical protein